ncbi:MAG: hypothetical protein AAF439_08720 [Pseudomonadota bacterium]
MTQGLKRTAWSLLFGAALIGAPANAATDLLVPPGIGSAMQAANSASDIADIVRREPRFAATVMADAAALGVASPAAVIAAAAPGMTCGELYPIVQAAAEAAPFEADATVTSALGGATCPAAKVAAAAVDGTEVAGLSAEDVATEAAEIIVAATVAAPVESAAIALAVANATETTTDSAEGLAEIATGAIETADTDNGPTPVKTADPVTFINLPGEEDGTPSPN